MRRHEQKRNQTPTRAFSHAGSGDQSFDRDYSRNDVPDSDRHRSENNQSTYYLSQNEDRDGSNSKTHTYDYPRPRGGDDLFRNNDNYTEESDQRDRKNARLGLGRMNYSARWTGHEGTGHYGKGPKGYRRSDDRVKEDVSEALYCDQHIDASDIEIDVKDGTVFLRGIVESRQIKRAAEDCVDHLTGVEDVRNELTLKKEDPSSLSNFSGKSNSEFKNQKLA